MNEIELNGKVKEYADLSAQKDAIEARLAELKGQIVEGIGGVGKFDADDGTVASVTEKVTFKYQDEPGIIAKLKDGGLTSYIKESVNSTMLNKELKKGGTLNESLSPMFVKSTGYALTVKRV
jgi:hypothetical protein